MIGVSNMNSPLVSIIILNYNGKQYNGTCIDSLINQSYQNFEIVFVDNASSDGSLEEVERLYKELINKKQLKIVKLKENIGFAGGNNRGVKEASKNSKYIVLLNNDTYVSKTWLAEMLKAMNMDKSIGVVTPIVYNHHDEELVKKFIHKQKKRVTLNIFGENVAVHNPMYNSEQHPIFFAGGCCLMYKKRLVDAPFMMKQFAYAEDNYFSWLINMKGYMIIQTLKSKVWHYGNGVKKQNKINALLEFHGTKNLIMNFFLFYEFWNIVKLFPAFMMIQAAHILYQPRKLRYKLHAWGWIIKNFKYILSHRKHIQHQRMVSDKILFKEMSYKAYDVEGVIPIMRIPLRIFNMFMKMYCKILLIRTGDM